MKNRYDEDFAKLNLDIIRMGAMTEQAIESAMTVLTDRDVNLAKRLIEDDLIVDNMEKQIESKAMQLIMQQHPSQERVRIISSSLKMITDLERICDQAADIAEIAIVLCSYDQCHPPERIISMGKHAVEMVRMAVDSYVKLDVELADKVIQSDDVQDEFFDLVKNELVDLLIEDRQNVDRAVDFIQIAKYLERIGDHAENIAEWTCFAKTGVYRKNNRNRIIEGKV